MTPSPTRRPSRRRTADRRGLTAALVRRYRAGVSSGEGGFSLIETVVSISLIVLVMAAFSTFFVNTVAFTSLQRANQAATAVANSMLERIRALPPSDLVTGRDATSVAAQLQAAPAPVSASLISMGVGVGAAVDPSATAGGAGPVTVPIAPTATTLNGVVFNTSVYLGNCTVVAGVTVGANCAPAAAPTGYLRAVVAVTWTGSRCPATGCSYVTSTLVSTADDPLFNPRQAPPAAPVLTNPGAQTSAVGDVVTLPVTVSAVPSYRVNLTSGTLPAGLALDTATGRITGSPVTAAAATSLTLTLTDGFGRTTTAVFAWTIVPALAAETPPAQAGVIGTPVTALTVRAGGGTAPYTWSDVGTTLPPGLTLTADGNNAVVTGTPTTFGTFPVTLRVTDAVGRTSTTTFTWNVDYPPFAASNPGAQTGTVGAVDTLALSVTGGSGAFAWTGGGTLPAGLTLTPGGMISGTPTTAGAKSVTLVATDARTNIARTVAFTWTVYTAPTVTAPGGQQSVVGAAVSLQAGANCPNSPCTFRLNNGPATLGVSNTGLITGTITSSPQTFAAVTVTITDSAGATATSGSFSWVVASALPSAPQAVAVVNADSAITVSWTPPTGGGGVTGYTVTLSPGGATCTTTEALSCTVGGLTNGTTYAVTVTASTSGGTGPASAAARGIPYPSVMSASNGLTLWLDATDPVFTTAPGCTGNAATTTIGCWKDKSGAGRNFAQTSSSNQPSVGTWNGLPAATFTDTSDVLNSVNATGVYQTVFVAANLTNSGSSAQWVDLFGQADNDYNVRLGTNGERSSPNANDWSYNSSGTGAQFNWINGAQGVRGSPPGPTITSDQAPSARTFTASVSNTIYGRGLTGQVGDVITFNRALTTTERRSVEEYLSRKWGVVITPQAPTITSAAASAVSWTAPTYNGGSAVTGYTVTATTGTTSTRVCSTTATTCAVSGLSRNTNYTFTVTANNTAGAGPASAASAVVRP